VSGNLIYEKRKELWLLNFCGNANHTNSPDIYGSTEAVRVDGTGVSALLTWDSKVTTVNAVLGGVTDFVRQKMKADNVYDEFVDIMEVRYSRAALGAFRCCTGHC
jgi:hypothetical protein